MKVLVLTGGIGSGKSYISSLFASRNIPVYDSDSMVKGLYDVDLVRKLEIKLGEVISDAQGRLNKAAFASIIFSDKEKLRLVEALIFPLLLADFERWCDDGRDGLKPPFVVFESATILEKDFFANFGDKTLLVDAPIELRIERAMSRDGVSRESVVQRMNNQPKMNHFSIAGEGLKYDFIIHNNKDRGDLEKSVAEVYLKCLSLWAEVDIDSTN